MHKHYQLREEPSVYTMIDTISAAVKVLPEANLNKEEHRVFLKYCEWVDKLLDQDRYREVEVNNLACAAFAHKDFSVFLLLKKIERIDKKRSNYESRIMCVGNEPLMHRVLNLGTDYLRKNPHLRVSHKREYARNNQDYQIDLVRGHSY